MQWGAPERLHALWVIIPAFLLVMALVRHRDRKLRAFVDPALWATMLPGLSPRRARTRALIWVLALACCLTALSRPQWGYRLEERTQEGMDLLVVLDTSRSMLAQDVKPNRLQRAKWGIRDLVQQLTGDRIGLIAFAGSSFLQCPLTSDYDAFLMTLEDVYAGIIPRGGTAIEQALRQAADTFNEKGGQADRAVLLITDGEDHEGDALSLVETLQEKEIKIYSVGVGTLEGDMIYVRNDQGDTERVKNREGNVVMSRLKESTLEQLALATGGMYVRSAPGDFGLERIYEQGLAHLQRKEQQSRTFRTYHERFLWFLVPGFGLFAMEAMLRERRRPRRSKSGGSTS